MLRSTGSLPQNVNYAVKSSYVLPLLDLADVPFSSGQDESTDRRLVDVIADVKKAVGLVKVYSNVASGSTDVPSDEDTSSAPVAKRLLGTFKLRSSQWKSEGRLTVSLTRDGRSINFQGSYNAHPESDPASGSQGSFHASVPVETFRENSVVPVEGQFRNSQIEIFGKKRSRTVWYPPHGWLRVCSDSTGNVWRFDDNDQQQGYHAFYYR